MICQKVVHDSRSGYLHEADDDRPYDVDGVEYCGRCHIALPHPESGGWEDGLEPGWECRQGHHRNCHGQGCGCECHTVSVTPHGRVPREHMEEELADWTLIPRDRFTSLPYEALDFMHTVACSARMGAIDASNTENALTPDASVPDTAQP